MEQKAGIVQLIESMDMVMRMGNKLSIWVSTNVHSLYRTLFEM